jgi:hypothetical protein
VACVGDGGLARGEKAGRLPGELLTRACEPDATSVAREQGDAEFVLEPPDLPRERGLSDVEGGGGPSVVEPFGDREEVPEFAQVEVER